MSRAGLCGLAATSFHFMGTAVGLHIPPPTDLRLSTEQRERAALFGVRWHSSYEAGFSRAAKVAAEGGMSEDDLRVVLSAVKTATGANGRIIFVSTFDGGMVDLAQNMMMSLDAVSSQVHRLIVGIGHNVCESLSRFALTTCVSVFRNSSTAVGVTWGSQQYWEVVFRKHVVLSVIATSNISSGMIYSDPDIVYCKSPVLPLVLGLKHDIMFTPNSMLERNANSVDDLAAQYSTRGIPSITQGPHQRHPDINTGLFYMRTSEIVVDLFLKAMGFLRHHKVGHYQQFCLLRALSEMDGIQFDVASAEEFVNGNVFWGHRGVLSPRRVVSIHANWMQKDQKRQCLKAARLWLLGAGSPLPTASQLFENSTEHVVMDDRFATVKECSTMA